MHIFSFALLALLAAPVLSAPVKLVARKLPFQPAELEALGSAGTSIVKSVFSADGAGNPDVKEGQLRALFALTKSSDQATSTAATNVLDTWEGTMTSLAGDPAHPQADKAQAALKTLESVKNGGTFATGKPVKTSDPKNLLGSAKQGTEATGKTTTSNTKKPSALGAYKQYLVPGGIAVAGVGAGAISGALLANHVDNNSPPGPPSAAS